jgi:hypothetical protein
MEPGTLLVSVLGLSTSTKLTSIVVRLFGASGFKQRLKQFADEFQEHRRRIMLLLESRSLIMNAAKHVKEAMDNQGRMTEEIAALNSTLADVLSRLSMSERNIEDQDEHEPRQGSRKVFDHTVTG